MLQNVEMLLGLAHAVGGAAWRTTVKNIVSDTDCISFSYPDGANHQWIFAWRR